MKREERGCEAGNLKGEAKERDELASLERSMLEGREERVEKQRAEASAIRI